ncbi:Glycoside hydrolase superfamily [Cinara cedri]|uniref:Glycoside hydrolase superfamily n=1 Tax=Cinara cedri TaxID=506608 RepID=A0A5E4NHD7_9HEMI|nr:Glycoside hydrolase superfamily [Cinara cedri]
MPACRIIVKTMLGVEAEKEIIKIPLSDSTMSRRIINVSEDIEKQTLVPRTGEAVAPTATDQLLPQLTLSFHHALKNSCVVLTTFPPKDLPGFLSVAPFLKESLDTVPLSDIKIVCCISKNNNIDSIPKDSPCTAVSWYSSDEPKLKNIDSLAANLKRVCIYNDKNYGFYSKNLKTDNMESFIKDLSTMIDDKRIDVLIFDNMYLPYNPYALDYAGYKEPMQTDIYGLFKALQVNKPNTLFGLLIRTSPDPGATRKIRAKGTVGEEIRKWGQPRFITLVVLLYNDPIDRPKKSSVVLPSGFKLVYLQEVIPLFLYPACDLVDCNYDLDKSKMAPQDPADKVEDQIKTITSQVKSSKILMSIRIGVASSKSFDYPLTADTYTTYCSTKASQSRRFCIDNLSNFYKKGKLVSTHNLAGVFIFNYDFDDYKCKCGCGCYAATTAISAGVQGSPEPELTKCKDWTIQFNDRK